ncbi:MAG: polysaccharide deacetylase family protein [Clostridiales bacterium]|nr:polysaccharide deacetylase family protein [Clostridiales bacterium]
MNRKAAVLLGTAALGYSILPTCYYKCKNHLHHPAAGKTLYLTFDDGPDPRYTPQLLDLLEQYQIPASFFVVAQSAQANPALIARMKRSGHVVGLHSLSHKNGLIQPPRSACRDFSRSVAILQQCGIPPRYFRPPWGHWNAMTAAQAYSRGIQPMMWDVMAEDWRGDTTAQEIAHKLLTRTFDGAVICLHDGRGKNNAPARTIAALRQVLPQWLAAGYCFQTVDHYDT